MVDFLSPSLRKRCSQSWRKDLLAKAVGIKPNYRPTLIDATAGLGIDAFVLAQYGCSVRMIERSPVMVALLKDGLERARQFDLHCALPTLIEADAIAYLQALPDAERPDVIYCDPMFPKRAKTALPRKSMQWLRDVVGGDLDADQLIDVALQKAKQRVVIKGSAAQGLRQTPYPSYCVEGSAGQFQVIFPQK